MKRRAGRVGVKGVTDRIPIRKLLEASNFKSDKREQ